MHSKDIFARVNQLMFLQNNVIPMIPLNREEQARKYQKALLEYGMEKLIPNDKNKVIVEDLGFILDRLEEQLTDEEKQDFFANFVHSIIYAYGDLTGEPILWEIVDENKEGDFPTLTGEYTKFFQTKASMDNKEIALYAYKMLEEKLEKQKTYQKKNNRQEN